MSTTAHIRRLFRQELIRTLVVVWPILSGLLIIIASLGLLVAHLEGWGLLDGIYFAFVTGLTIGYGDLVPHQLLPQLAHLLALGGEIGLSKICSSLFRSNLFCQPRNLLVLRGQRLLQLLPFRLEDWPTLQRLGIGRRLAKGVTFANP